MSLQHTDCNIINDKKMPKVHVDHKKTLRGSQNTLGKYNRGGKKSYANIRTNSICLLFCNIRGQPFDSWGEEGYDFL